MDHDRLYQVLSLISESPRLSQRDVASSTGLSLGLVNLTLKRLAQTGYIKVSSLNRKKVEYILTPKGLMEKTRRTYSYLSRTMKTFQEYHRRMQDLVKDIVKDDRRTFAVQGESEIVGLLEMALRSSPVPVSYRVLKAGESPAEGETLLDCRLNGFDGKVGVGVLAQLLGGRPSSVGPSGDGAKIR